MSGQDLRGRRAVVRRRDLLWRRTLDRVIVLAPGAEQVVVLEGTGVELWDLLAEATDLHEVVDTLAARHGAAIEQVAPDLELAVEELAARGLIAEGAT